MTVSERAPNQSSTPVTRDRSRHASPGRSGPGADEAPPFLAAWLALWTTDPGAIAEVYTADAVWEDVASGLTVPGRDQIQAHILAAIAEERSAIPTGRREVRSAFAAGNRAAVEIAFSGAYTGILPGLPPGAGQPVLMRGVVVFELDGAMIRRESHYYDPSSLLTQLGMEPPVPEGPSTP